MSSRPVYGFPCVENPNDFEPDPECCSPEEIERHRVACANFGKPSYEPNKGCFSERSEDGSLIRHVTRTSWGIGANYIAHCDGCDEPNFDGLITCYECGGPEFCAVCWPEHEERHETGDLR